MSKIQNITFQAAQNTTTFVDPRLFGSNALADVNTDADGNPTESFIRAVRDFNVTDLRFPGGTAELLNDILAETTANRLSPQTANFLNWVRAENANGAELTVTLGIPTKRVITYDEVYNFARIVARDYADVVKAVEIGNEYSIGDDTITETVYGQRADIAARALDAGFKASGLFGDNQPDIVLQMAEIFGKGSTYNGTSDHLAANTDLVSHLSTPAIAAIDAVVNHYYYVEEHMFSEDFADPSDSASVNRETRFLFNKLDAFDTAWAKVAGDKELDFYMTEWNVNRLNYDQHGQKAASVLLKQMSYMLDMGVDVAHFWPVQHKTGSAIAGNSAGPFQPTPGGALFSLMSDSLVDKNDPMAVLDLSSLEAQLAMYMTSGFALNAFQNDAKTVVYVSSRSAQDIDFTLDVRALASQINGYSAAIVGYDRVSANGLSEMGDENGLNRTAKRSISENEYEKLKTLAFFDETNRNHIDISESANGMTRYKTYLPTFADIIPLVANPKGIEDYYFASESDVSGQIEYLSQAQLGSPQALEFTLNPYEVIEITLTHMAPVVKTPKTAPQAPVATDVYADANGSVDLPQNAVLQLFSAPISAPLPMLNISKATTYSNGADRIYADDADNFISSGAGNDLINGYDGNDTLLGGDGDDIINGAKGDDYINGGAGMDELRGGAGADTFVFDAKGQAGCDVIVDFNPDEDTLAFLNVSAGQKLGQFHNISVIDSDQGAVVEFDEYCVILNGIDAHQVDINDMIFV